jgi:2-polyprenyl-3-methyl-5-hydroxy-6-metoxy-1,4-benzoquinol methylase
MSKPEKFWDRMAGSFDRPDAGFSPVELRTIENTKKYLRPGDVVLDYGCAAGTITCEFAAGVQKVHGIDFSAKMIDAARRKAAGRGIENVSFTQSTLFDERLTNESYDAILAFSILHLLPDPQQAIARINDLLKPGGLMASVTVCLGEKRSRFVGSAISLLGGIGILPPVRFFTTAGLRESITGGKFEIIEVENLLEGPSTGCFIVARKVIFT